MAGFFFFKDLKKQTAVFHNLELEAYLQMYLIPVSS